MITFGYVTGLVKGRYHVLSDCGQYSVCAVNVAGRWTYEAWRTREHPDGPHLIRPGLPTAEAAKLWCQIDGDPENQEAEE